MTPTPTTPPESIAGSEPRRRKTDVERRSNPRIWNRKLHRWGAIVVAVPFLLVLVTGVLLQVKKQVVWVQPAEVRTESTTPTIAFDRILDTVRTIQGAGISSWEDVDRVDVRPSKGHLKVIGNSRWEVQMDIATGRVLQVAYRRSDLIETLHDGSWFHDAAKVWIFLPVALVVLGLWVTGMYLWILPYMARKSNQARRLAKPPPHAPPVHPKRRVG